MNKFVSFWYRIYKEKYTAVFFWIYLITIWENSSLEGGILTKDMKPIINGMVLDLMKKIWASCKHKKKRKKERKGKKRIRRKERKKKIYHLRTQIFVWLLHKFQVNSMIIMYRNFKYYYEKLKEIKRRRIRNKEFEHPVNTRKKERKTERKERKEEHKKKRKKEFTIDGHKCLFGCFINLR